jgi:hypothetical protein
MTLPSSLIRYVTMSDNIIGGANGPLQARINMVSQSTGSGIIAMQHGNTNFGFEFLPDPAAPVMQYRYSNTSTSNILIIRDGGVIVNYSRVNVEHIGVANQRVGLVAVVDIYASQDTGNANVALNTLDGLPRILATVDTTGEGVLQLFTGSTGGIEYGTKLSFSSIATATGDFLNDIYLHNSEDSSIAGQLTVDISNNILWNGTSLVNTGMNLGSTFSSITVSSIAVIDTVSVSQSFISSIRGTAKNYPSSLSYLIAGKKATACPILWSSDGYNFFDPESNGLFNDEAYKIAEDGMTGITIAVGHDASSSYSTVQYSSDGRNWTYITDLPFISSATAVYKGPKLWLIGGTPAVDTVAPLVFSSDGLQYFSPTEMPEETGRTAYAFSHYNGQFVAGLSFKSTSMNTLIWSTDCLSWKRANTGGFRNAALAVENNGKGLWVAGGNNNTPGGSNIQWSRNGRNWFPRSIPYINHIKAVGQYKGLWVAGGLEGSGGTTSSIVWSTDGSNWNPQQSGTMGTVNSIRNFRGLWYAAGSATPSTNQILQSSDGSNWVNFLGSKYFNDEITDIGFNYLLTDTIPTVNFTPSTVVNMTTINASTGYISSFKYDYVVGPIIYQSQIFRYE